MSFKQGDVVAVHGRTHIIGYGRVIGRDTAKDGKGVNYFIVEMEGTGDHKVFHVAELIPSPKIDVC